MLKMRTKDKKAPTSRLQRWRSVPESEGSLLGTSSNKSNDVIATPPAMKHGFFCPEFILTGKIKCKAKEAPV